MILPKEYESYRHNADLIPNWKKTNKNQLLKLAYEHYNNEDFENYFSACMCKYWGYISFYSGRSKGLLSAYDCYDLLVDTLLYTIKKHKWTDETSSVYGQENAPNKIVNQVMSSQSLNKFKSMSTDKRQLNFFFNCLTLDKMYEDYGETIELGVTDLKEEEHFTSKIVNEVISWFLKKNKLSQAICVDVLCFKDTYSKNADGEYILSKKKLVNQLHNLDLDYQHNFLHKYKKISKNNINLVNSIETEIDKLKSIPSHAPKVVDKTLKELYYSKDIKEVLGLC